MDELLRPLCLSHDAHKRAALIEDLLLNVAQPIIQRVLRSQLRADNEAEDISQEAMLRVWQRLESLSERNGIDDFSHWVAHLTLNLCRDTWRSRTPQRVRLKRRLRELLRKDETFRFEQNGNGEWLCGLAEWQDGIRHHNGKQNLDDLAALSGDSVVALDSHEPFSRETITDFLCGIGHFIELNELVSVIVEWQGIREERVSLPNEIAVTDSTTLQFKLLLRQLWRIAHRLPMPQRRVLTLGELPDYETALANLWLIHKTINASDLALWLDMPSASLQNLLPDLPLSNATLSEQFALTLEQISKARYRALQKLRTELPR
jgi:RNA polymerase sigma factor (sigma-70 family)